MVATADDTDPDAWRSGRIAGTDCGAQVVPAANDAHDRAVAAISHLPHLTANATAAVGAGRSGLALRLAAGGFRDGTRVAGTAPALQRAMLEANRIALLNTLSETIDRLIAARDDLRDSRVGRDHRRRRSPSAPRLRENGRGTRPADRRRGAGCPGLGRRNAPSSAPRADLALSRYQASTFSFSSVNSST